MGDGMGPGRASVWRTALFFTPLFLAGLALEGYLAASFASEPSGSAIPGLVIVGVITLLLGFESVQALRDLLATPRELEDVVTRTWTRTDAFVFRNAYAMVARRVFRLTPEQALEVREGDVVRVRFFPHTNTLIEIDRVGRKEQPR
jgi:hypothetical protein